MTSVKEAIKGWAFVYKYVTIEKGKESSAPLGVSLILLFPRMIAIKGVSGQEGGTSLALLHSSIEWKESCLFVVSCCWQEHKAQDIRVLLYHHNWMLLFSILSPGALLMLANGNQSFPVHSCRKGSIIIIINFCPCLISDNVTGNTKFFRSRWGGGEKDDEESTTNNMQHRGEERERSRIFPYYSSGIVSLVQKSWVLLSALLGKGLITRLRALESVLLAFNLKTMCNISQTLWFLFFILEIVVEKDCFQQDEIEDRKVHLL